MGKIVAIGGGEIGDGETLDIDKRVVELAGNDEPSVLFVPTASGDDRGYVKKFKGVYEDELGCNVKPLYLLDQKPTKESLVQQAVDADIIYVGGGNTLKMMRRWRFLGFDDALREAHYSGTVLTGLSAGSICWFDFGHSDSYRFYDYDDWDYIRVTGLGLLPGIHCPHFDSEGRREGFKRMVDKFNQTGIAVDNKAALEVIDDEYKILRSDENASAYKVYKDEEVVVEELDEEGVLDNFG